MREGPGYFLFESRRPFEHVTCVPRARPQQGQHASPAGRSHRRPRRRQGGKGWQGRRQGRWKGGGRGAPDPLCAAALNARYTRLEPAERRRQSCGRRRPHTASSAVETAPRAAARCATTAVARLVAMDAPDPLAPPPSTPDTRSEPAERRRRSCGRRRPSPRPRRRPVDKHVRTAIEKKETEGGASGARGRSGRGSGRGRARGNQASGGDNASGGSAGGARRAPRRSPARS